MKRSRSTPAKSASSWAAISVVVFTQIAQRRACGWSMRETAAVVVPLRQTSPRWPGGLKKNQKIGVSRRPRASSRVFPPRAPALGLPPATAGLAPAGPVQLRWTRHAGTIERINRRTQVRRPRPPAAPCLPRTGTRSRRLASRRRLPGPRVVVVGEEGVQLGEQGHRFTVGGGPSRRCS